jgi:hypothetical protein
MDVYSSWYGSKISSWAVLLVQNDYLIAMAPVHHAVNDASTIISQVRFAINDEVSPPSVVKAVVSSVVFGKGLQVGVFESKVEAWTTKYPQRLVCD